jgi:hypothetical protein
MDFRCLSIGNSDASQASHLKKRGEKDLNYLEIGGLNSLNTLLILIN